MSPYRQFLLLLPLAALCGCATATVDRVAVGQAKTPSDLAGSSAYGLFLAGQSAINKGRGEEAATYFARAASVGAATDSEFLGARTFTAALLAGDVPKAAALAVSEPGSDPDLRHLASLTRGVEALATGQGAKARAILSGPDVGPPHQTAAALLAPFAAAQAGDVEASIAHPVITGDPVGQFFASLDQGKLFERAHRYEEAETAYRALIAGGDPGAIASISLGEMLERRGREAEAVAIYNEAIARGADDGALSAARARGSHIGPRRRRPASWRRRLRPWSLRRPCSLFRSRTRWPWPTFASPSVSIRLGTALGFSWAISCPTSVMLTRPAPPT